MFNHDNLSLISITSEELVWLDASVHLLKESPCSTPIDLNPPPLSLTCSDSGLFTRRTVSPPRHHYQRSTKSSSAKVVTPRPPSSFAPKRPNHPNLCSTTLSTSLSTPSLSSTSETNDHIDILPLTDSADPSCSTERSHSPIAPQPRSPEWIYRRPKSPSTPPASARYRRRPEINRSASETSTMSQGTISYFSEFNSSTPLLPSPSFPYLEEPDSPRWTSLLRPRKGSGSVASKSSNNTPEIPSIWFSADDGASRTEPSSSSRFLRGKKPSLSSLTTNPPASLSKSPSLRSVNGPISKQAIRVQRNRSSSVSSSISTISTATTATTSSIPQTPTSPSSSPSISKKFKPHHQCIAEDTEPESEPEDKLMAPGEGISIRRKDPSFDAPSTPPILAHSLGSFKRRPRLDTGSCSSSSKSVKFVEKPTVRYASGGYDSDFWHVPGESMDAQMGLDDDHMDVENEDDNGTEAGHQQNPPVYTISHPYASAALGQHMQIDEHTPKKTSPGLLSGYLPQDREMSCVTPTPERVHGRDGRGLRRIVSKSMKRQPRQPTSAPTWRSAPSSSPSRSVTPRPSISGPFVLGSTPSLYGTAPCPPRGRSRSKLEAGGIALRSAPSLESFRSVKSSSRSIRSLRSLRSLRSIPESVKSSIEVGAREMKDWFKDRMSIGVAAL
ncbi:hypothetical protein PM082_015080 [Marasmius tenuissimus]|nr:hypothetical protein PM082_015080 [Marasmius tenuissimus]